MSCDGKQKKGAAESESNGASSIRPVMVVQGGAGDIPTSRIAGKIRGVRAAVLKGNQVLENGGTALDAVEAAVKLMEDDEYFNCGYGSVLTLDGQVEMSASIMDGATMGAGAVAIIRDRKYPISLARLVMEKTPHVLLVDDGARRFADKQGVPSVDPESFITEFARQALEDFKQHGGDGRIEIGTSPVEREGGTVGAVAMDCAGHVAAATSTGGMTGKYPGRVGDTPQLGAGTMANDEMGAVSTTGHGEAILKWGLAHSILMRMHLKQDGCGHPQVCTEKAVAGMTNRLKKTGGAITVSPDGEIGVHFSSARMAWASVKNGTLSYGIDNGKSESEPLGGQLE